MVSAHPSPSARRRRLPLVAASTLVLLLGGWWGSRGLGGGEAAPAPRTAVARHGEIVVRVRETGTVIPRLAVEVKSKVGGEVVELPVVEGQTVEARAVLAEIDETDFASRVRQAEADLAAARARLSVLVEGTRPQEIAQAAAEVARAEIALADSRRTEQRRRALAREGFIASSDVDAAATERELAEQALVRAREALSLAREGSRGQEIVQARAAVVRAEDVLRNAREQLRDTTIRAPISGTVLKRKVNKGEIVTAGSVSTSVGTLLMVVADLSELLVRSKVNEVDIPKVRLGQPAEIRLDAIRGALFAGEVVRIAPAGERDAAKNLVTYEVDVRITDRDPRIRPEMTAAVDVVVGRDRNALLLPSEAVERRDGHETVLLERGSPPASRFDPVTVSTGLRNETTVAITGGLEAGAVVRLPDLAPEDARSSPDGGRRGSRSVVH